jgi:hypothetical protein
VSGPFTLSCCALKSLLPVRRLLWTRPAPALWLGGACLSGLLLVALANLLINPFRLYNSQLVATGAVNYRLVKLEMLRTEKPPAQTAIIGSSRCMTLDPRDVQLWLGGECFNFGMQGATAEDYYAGLRAAVEQAGAPLKHLVLAIDFEAFNPGVPVMYETRSAGQFARYLDPQRNTSGAAPWKYKLAMLLAPEQTSESVSYLRRLGREATEDQSVVLEPGGMAVMRWREEAIAAGRFDLEAILDRRLRKYPERSLQLSKYSQPDQRRLRYLEQTLEYCAEHGIRVHAYLTPYHPRLWTLLNDLPDTQVLAQARVEIEAVCRRHGVVLHDFSHIESFGGDPQLFYDEIHLQPENQRRIAAALLGVTDRANDL